MELTQKEKDKIRNFCFKNNAKSCAIAQQFINNLQLISAADYARLKGKSKRNILYRAEKLHGVEIDNRKFICLVQ